MASQDAASNEAAARRTLIALIQADHWEITKTAREQGKEALRGVIRDPPGECAIIDYILGQLQAGFPILPTPLGEPAGSAGIGWVMNNPDGRHTYIKLKVAEDGVHEFALVMSCKPSKHHKP
jgi:hypothetical protein